MQIKLPALPQIQSALSGVAAGSDRDPQSGNGFQKQLSKKKKEVVKTPADKGEEVTNTENLDLNQQVTSSSHVVDLLDSKPPEAVQKVREFQKKNAELPKKNPKGLNRIL